MNPMIAGVPVDPKVSAIRELLLAHKFPTRPEAALQRAIYSLLQSRGYTVEREACLTKALRIDLLIHGGIGVEIKVSGTLADVGRQIALYLEQPELSCVILATTCAQHKNLPNRLLGKNIHVVQLTAHAF